MYIKEVKYRNREADDDRARDIERSFTAMFSTIKGTIPLKRGYGIDAGILDNPLSVVKTLLAENIYNCADEYERRADITDVTFEYDTENDAICPIIEYEVLPETDESYDLDDYEAEEEEDYEQN